MKKRTIFSLLLAVSLLASLTACGKTETVGSSTSVPEPVVESSSSEAVEPESSSVAPVKNTAGKPDFGPLSDDIYAFQTEINGEVYQFPMTFAQFEAYGWEYAEDAAQTLDSGYYTVGERFTKDGMQCTVHIVNFDVNPIKITDGYIAGISIDSDISRKADKPDAIKIILPKGITYNTSTAEEARAAYGTPSRENLLSSGTEVLTYEKDYDQEVKLTFDSETKLLSNITIENYAIPEDFTPTEVSTEVPAIVTSYKAPSAISDKFADWTVEYGGKLYTLPAPISEFIADGWTIDTAESEATVNGRGSARIQLRKDNQKLRVYAYNYSENATAIENAFIGKVVSDDYDTRISLKISKGITIGTSEADVKKLLEGTTFTVEDSSSFTYYKVTPTDKLTESYVIMIEKETGKVNKIEVMFQPNYNDYVK